LFYVLGQQVVDGSDGCDFDLLAGIAEKGQDGADDWPEVFVDLSALGEGEAYGLQALDKEGPVLLVGVVVLGFCDKEVDCLVVLFPGCFDVVLGLVLPEHLAGQFGEVCFKL
jgi:hypothetical protein